jgi:hypothetical protein
LAYVARHASAASSFPPRETTFLDALFISQQLIETSLSAVDDINMHVLGPFELWSGFAASQTASFISTVIVSKKKKKKHPRLGLTKLVAMAAAPCLPARILLAIAALLSPLVMEHGSAVGYPVLPVCRNSGNYSVNSTYQSNLLQLAATVPTKASRSPDLFEKGSVGAGPATIYVLALCRGDASGSACGSCVAAAFQAAQKLCPFDRDATLSEELCYIRFSDLNFLVTMENGDPIKLPSGLNVTSPVTEFDEAVGILLNATSSYAATNSSRRFATAVEDFDDSSPSIYGLSQCTPDMSPVDCRRCLAGLISTVPQYFSGLQGGRLTGLRCSVRYELYSFFYGEPTLRLPRPPPSTVSAPTPPTTPGGEMINLIICTLLR